MHIVYKNFLLSNTGMNIMHFPINISIITSYCLWIGFIFLFFFLFILFFFPPFYFFIVVDFVIHWNETATGLHVFLYLFSLKEIIVSRELFLLVLCYWFQNISPFSSNLFQIYFFYDKSNIHCIISLDLPGWYVPFQ